MPRLFTHFTPQDAVQFSAAGHAKPRIVEGTNFPIAVLRFPDAVTSETFFKLRAALYTSGNLRVDIDWYAESVNAGDVRWDAAIAALTPNTDDVNIEAKVLATAVAVTSPHLGGNVKRLHRTQLFIDQLDSLAGEDEVFLRVRRLGADGLDTLPSEVRVTHIALSYDVP